MTTGTLMPESDHAMVTLMSEHLAALESVRAVYRQLDVTTAPLEAAAERVFDETLQGDKTTPSRHARYEMPYVKTNEFLLARRAYENASMARSLLPQSLVLGMISQHDAFVAKLIRALYQLKPGLRQKIRHPFSVDEMQSMESIDQAVDKLVDEEIRSVLRESHSKQLAWLERLLDMSLTSNTGLLDRFREVTQRRHLYAHTAGVINSQYLAARRAIDPHFDGQVGDQLELTREEFEEAYVVLVEMSVKLWQVTWRKACPDQAKLAEEALYSLNYVLLVFEDFVLAERLLRFAVGELKKVVDQISRKNIVNLAQCYKWMGQEELCQATLNKDDWSACDDAFSLALAVLREDFDLAESLMLSTGRAGYVVEAAFRDWPLFREFRESPQYARAFSQLFDETAEQAA